MNISVKKPTVAGGGVDLVSLIVLHCCDNHNCFELLTFKRDTLQSLSNMTFNIKVIIGL